MFKMQIKTMVSFEIPVHQKLTEGINKMHHAAMFFLWVFNFKISSKIRQEAIAEKKAKNKLAAKQDFNVKNETNDPSLQINQASGSL